MAVSWGQVIANGPVLVMLRQDMSVASTADERERIELVGGAVPVARGPSMSRKVRWIVGVLVGFAVALLTHPTFLEGALGDAATTWSKVLQVVLLSGLLGVLAW